MGVLAFIALQITAMLAALVQSATGFGFAIIAIGPFLWLFGSRTAVTVIMALTLAISVLLLPRVWRDVNGRRTAWLVLGAGLGFYPGFLLATTISLTGLKLAVGVFIAGFAVLLLLSGTSKRVSAPVTSKPAADVAIGVISGLLATAMAMPGPIVMLYLTAQHIDKEGLRATILLHALFAYAGALIIELVWGATPPLTITAETLPLLPAVVFGAFAGHLLTARLSGARFRQIVILALLLSGLVTLGQSLSAW